MDDCMSPDKLLEQIAQRNIVIYGAGHIAGKFLKALKLHHYDENVLCFVVTSPEQGLAMMEGIPVRTVEWLAEHKDALICIAVHEALRYDIAAVLRNIGVSEYIWIYPYLYELLLGKPVGTNREIDLDEIIRTCEDDYRLAIRYAVIEQYFGKNKVGYDLYRRAQALHSSRETAEERLISFCSLIGKWQKNGYDGKSRIAINTDYEIIDGNHRVALAKYYDQPQIMCDIYEKYMDVTELHGENAMLTGRVLREGGFDDMEMDYLDQINRIIKGG